VLGIKGQQRVNLLHLPAQLLHIRRLQLADLEAMGGAEGGVGCLHLQWEVGGGHEGDEPCRGPASLVGSPQCKRALAGRALPAAS